MNYEKLPIIRKLYSKYKEKDRNLRNEILQLATQNLNLRFELKKRFNERINVVFVCWRPAVWRSLKTVYEQMKLDPSFSVKILVIPNKKELPNVGWNHEVYETEGGEEFWKGDDVIYGFNYTNQEWFDLKSLNPDYVFFQKTYNSQKPDLYKSQNVSKYAKICYIAYYAFFNSNTNNYINEGCTPEDFMRNVSFYFSQNSADYSFIDSKMKRIGNPIVNIVTTGFPRYDDIYNKATNLRLEKNKNIKLMWTPRWALDEGNCHFFDYKDKFLSLCKNNSNIDLILRPHPQAFSNYIAQGVMTESELQQFKEQVEAITNIRIDYSPNYIDTFNEVDCLVTDTSSMVAEFFLTGKPIIYCYKKNAINNFSKTFGYTSSFYFVENWNELIDTINLLKCGNDSLKEKRQSFLRSDFYLPKEGAGRKVVETIKNDFQGKV